MRIIAGKFRGLALASVGKGDAGAHLRPTTDRVRENLFNVLSGGGFGDPITGQRVLDLFAGTGALGLEALSRGAAHTTFVDDGRKAQSLIRRNIELTRSKDDTRLIPRNVLKLGPNDAQPFELIFLDPPYGKGLGAKALINALTQGWIAPDALIVWEEGAPQAAPDGFRLLDQRRYGDTHVTFLEPTETDL
ncbi:16S rRNA (guanine(966)-N(2))-methyltransferase RsmD [Qingshengfaniella alkalisoli]|uniref:16S rRNA (Guanine(966)-N(2))-methyltransferase RsmD n=1 Tax=Qingshengfaniella alkalisoli TaxID=2599296 RepID=A0A5B8IUW3_9RHOB|nr:16S rRNA (guanine(966)-N(2))-methyltransferase RsmD [Qingshengfaniella alkalisoli]QDY69912.1 16S rRNA (guanine(966)-N(2))-methyltransferase RsmD [Qingshengfaniella alkalisoli]